ncbi:hypothetical protein DC498_16860 [Terrimonas sp.]|uniref:hypothetical protein n=1 Tax=Terrimonas sp. TaxID=1914338 RepID=UPI000D52389F|nr:hypothetical protein [Terrimonas sp.]PVD51085.1 hypothetical protein DC498_16860 [Terrimonas sp.]
MKKTSTKKGVQRKPQPVLKWQTGDYERHAEFKFVLPYQFLLLCRLVDKTPEDIILDFADNLSCDTWDREGRDEAKEHLINYFIAHGYGQHHYSEQDIREMFKEMDALGLLFPKHGKTKLVDLYTNWRDKHLTHFFKKWFKKPGRKLSKKELA